jgi:hypothetical protein
MSSPRRGVMFMAQGRLLICKLRRSGMSMSPPTGLGLKEEAGAINMKSLRGFQTVSKKSDGS